LVEVSGVVNGRDTRYLRLDSTRLQLKSPVNLLATDVKTVVVVIALLDFLLFFLLFKLGLNGVIQTSLAKNNLSGIDFA
jgi:hypothetical protein